MAHKWLWQLPWIGLHLLILGIAFYLLRDPKAQPREYVLAVVVGTFFLLGIVQFFRSRLERT
jgi:hypothetical protein